MGRGSGRRWTELFRRLFLPSVAKRIPEDGLAMGKATVSFADGKLAFAFTGPDPLTIVSDIVAQEIMRHSPVEILGRKVFLDELHESEKLHSMSLWMDLYSVMSSDIR